MPRVKARCEPCMGTGLYVGFAEPKGTAVVCLACEGKGWKWLGYTEFKGREKRPGVNIIKKSAGAFIVSGVGPTGDAMTYAEFEQKHPV